MDWTKIKLVSLDVDGTLYSLQRMKWEFILVLLQRICSPEVLKVRPDLRSIRTFHAHMNRFRAEAKPYPVELHPELLQIETNQLTDWYGSAIRRSGPKDGLEKFLAQLQARRIKIVACSDYICDYKLRALGVADYFERTYEGTRTGRLKPLPSIMEQIRAENHLEWNEILHIGDDPIKDGSWPCLFHLIGPTFQDLLKTLDIKPDGV